jgi:hypothetical protein
VTAIGDQGDDEGSGLAIDAAGKVLLAGLAVQSDPAGATPAASTQFALVRYLTASGATTTTTTTTTTTSATTTTTPLAPASTSRPSISGTPRAGSTLTATTGSWSGTGPLAYSYLWSRCSATCTPIAGATSSTDKLTARDVGDLITVTVTAGGPGGSARAAAEKVGPIAPSSGAVHTALSKLLAITTKRGAIEALLGHGLAVAFSAPGPGTVQLAFYQVPKGAHISRATKKAKPVLVASGKATPKKATKLTVKVKLTGAGRKLLKHVARITLVAKGTYTPKGAKGTSTTRKLTFQAVKD